MARYLVVAHRTAKSPELAAKLKELLAQDPEARFVLLVPAVPLPGGSTRRTRCGAGPRRKRRRPSGPSGPGHPRGGGQGGGHLPLLAIEEELLAHPGAYQAIVLSTLPPGPSRWLRLDVHTQAERFGLPVIHVIAQAA